jgi:hypothetical protein
MNVKFTLKSGSSATAAGNFNISGTTNANVVSLLEAGVTKAQLLAGHTINGVNDAITGGTIGSTGTTCPSSTATWYVVQPTPTPTPEPTVTPTPTPTTDGGGGGGGCFIEGTNITLADGSQVLIETLQVGNVLKSFAIDTLPLYSDDDTVLTTWNTENLTGSQSTATIVSIRPIQVREIIVINNLLKTTPNHKHLVKHEGVWSFASAYMVVVGDIMLDINNNEFEITSVELQEVETVVYKMDVETLDVFYAENVLTHNLKDAESDGTYDCSGGGCIAAVSGAYSSLSACQASCGVGPS